MAVPEAKVAQIVKDVVDEGREFKLSLTEAEAGVIFQVIKTVTCETAEEIVLATLSVKKKLQAAAAVK